MKQRTAAALTIEQLVREKGGWVTMTPCFSGANGVTPILGGCEMKRFTWWRMEQKAPHNAGER